jgi:hypothetical protein
VPDTVQEIKFQTKDAYGAPSTSTASSSPMNPLTANINIHGNSIHVAPLTGPCYVECIRGVLGRLPYPPGLQFSI